MPNARNLLSAATGTRVMVYYAFVDESGNLSDARDRFFVVAAIGTTEPRSLKRVVDKIRNWLRNRGKRYHNVDELKFHRAEDETRTRLLQMLAQCDVEIYLLIVDKGSTSIGDTPQNYARAVWSLLKDMLAQHPNAVVVLDRHFVKKSQQLEVNRLLEERAGKALQIEHADSQQDARVQPADFVAGAGLAKYQRGDSRFLDILGEKIKERKVKWAETKKW